MADMATASLIYRKTAGAGAPEVNTLATLKTDLGTMPPSAHNILDSTYHGDALTGSITRGDLLYGDATPKIARFAKGAAGTYPTWDANDLVVSKLTLTQPATAATLTVADNTTVFITGGGTLALGGFTATIPATGTAAMLNQANSFTLINPLTTIAESWIGPSSTTGIYFKSANVGIGTTSPDKKLTVQGTSGSGYIHIVDDNTVAFSLDNTAASGRRWLFTSTNAGLFSIYDAGHLGGGGQGYVLTANPNGGIGVGTASFTGTGMSIMIGNVGIGTQAPTNLLSLGGNAARIFWMERHTTANTAGNNLLVQAGGATVAATDKNGGTVSVAPGLSTGMGFGSARLQRLTRADSTATADNSLIDAEIIPSAANLTNNSAIGLFTVSLPTLATAGGQVDYTITVTDGTDMQVYTGTMHYSAVNKGAVYTTATTDLNTTDAAASSSAATLAVTWTVTAGTNIITINVNANSSLTPTAMKIYYKIHNGSNQSITQL